MSEAEALVLDESGQNAIPADELEGEEVADTILRSEVVRGSQEDAKKVFAALLEHGSVSLEEDDEEEAEEVEEEEEVE